MSIEDALEKMGLELNGVKHRLDELDEMKRSVDKLNDGLDEVKHGIDELNTRFDAMSTRFDAMSRKAAVQEETMKDFKASLQAFPLAAGAPMVPAPVQYRYPGRALLERDEDRVEVGLFY